MGEHLNEKNGGARREFPVVGCEGGSVEKNQVWNGNGCGEILESPLLCVCWVLVIEIYLCVGRENLWVHLHV